MRKNNAKKPIDKDTEKPIIGFFPCFYSMGETIPLIKIAKSYLDLGGSVIFFSHRGEYEYLAEQLGCKIIHLSNILDSLTEQGQTIFTQGATITQSVKDIYNQEFIDNAVNEEVKAFNESNISLLVSSFNLTSSISARAANVPLVVIASGVTLPIYYESGHVTYPDNYENVITKLIPKSVKNYVAGWFLLHNKLLVKQFNNTAKKHNAPSYRFFNDIVLGDHTFICDDFSFLGLNPTKTFPRENFIGPIVGGGVFSEKKQSIDPEVLSHLKKPGKSIVLIMGSTGVKNLFLKIIEALGEMEYNVLAVYTNLLEENELPKTKDNILFKKFVPLEEILDKVDLAIIHGGRGTVYQVAYAGIPAICFPLLMEHEGNVGNLVRHESAIRLSKKYFKRESFINSVNQIFNNYETYLKNAKKLSKSLQVQPGEEVAAKRLIEILTKKN